MARQLAALLGRKNDTLLLATLSDLEKKTGSTGIDIQLLSEILQNAHRVMRLLRLDVRDITAKELYQALQSNSTKLTGVCDYTGLIINGSLVSFNVRDIAENNQKETVFTKRTSMHLHDALAAEIASRYLKQAHHHKRIVERLLATLTG